MSWLETADGERDVVVGECATCAALQVASDIAFIDGFREVRWRAEGVLLWHRASVAHLSLAPEFRVCDQYPGVPVGKAAASLPSHAIADVA